MMRKKVSDQVSNGQADPDTGIILARGSVSATAL